MALGTAFSAVGIMQVVNAVLLVMLFQLGALLLDEPTMKVCFRGGFADKTRALGRRVRAPRAVTIVCTHLDTRAVIVSIACGIANWTRRHGRLHHPTHKVHALAQVVETVHNRNGVILSRVTIAAGALLVGRGSCGLAAMLLVRGHRSAVEALRQVVDDDMIGPDIVTTTSECTRHLLGVAVAGRLGVAMFVEVERAVERAAGRNGAVDYLPIPAFC